MEVESKARLRTDTIEKTNSEMLLLCGVFSTMPIIGMFCFGKSISLYNICFIFSMAMNVVIFAMRGGYILIETGLEKIFIIWLVFAGISCLFGMLYYVNNQTGEANARAWGIKVIIYIIYVCFIFSNKVDYRYLLRGILIGAVCNAVWGVIDVVIYAIFRFSLTNKIFARFIALNSGSGMLDFFEGNVIRSSGLNTDPANMGFFASFLFAYGLYRKNYTVFILGILSIISSGSLTSVVSCFAIMVLWLIQEKRRIFKISKKSAFVLFAVLIFAIFGINSFTPYINQRLDFITKRFSEGYMKNVNDDLRIMYIKNFPKAVLNQGIKCVTGSGFGTGGSGYSDDADSFFVSRDSITRDIENCYIDYFFDLGIIGFSLYIYFLWLCYTLCRKKIKSKEEDYGVITYSGIVSIICCYVFYHYILYSVHLFVLISICLMSRERPRGYCER